MKHARHLALIALLPVSLACSGGGTPPPTSPTATAAPGGSAAAATSPKAGNNAPQVSLVSFRPAQADGYPTVNDKITANAATNDPDGDGVTVEWKWFHNGVEVTGQLSDTLSPNGTWKKHDKIEAEALPKDTRGLQGEPRRGLISIRNSTPTITSRPTGSLNGYKAVVQDADSTNANERFKWTLEAPVAGFTLGEDGTLRFDRVAVKDTSGGQKITLVVTDSAGGIAKQTFDVKF